MTGYAIFDGKNTDTTDNNLNIPGAFDTAKFAAEQQIPLLVQNLTASNVSLGGILTHAVKSSSNYVTTIGTATLTIASDDDVTVS